MSGPAGPLTKLVGPLTALPGQVSKLAGPLTALAGQAFKLPGPLTGLKSQETRIAGREIANPGQAPKFPGPPTAAGLPETPNSGQVSAIRNAARVGRSPIAPAVTTRPTLPWAAIGRSAAATQRSCQGDMRYVPPHCSARRPLSRPALPRAPTAQASAPSLPQRERRPG